MLTSSPAVSPACALSDEDGEGAAAPIQPRGKVITLEGLWGSGKSTTARIVGNHLTALGFRTQVIHYGPREGVQAALSDLLETQPLRSRIGVGGFRQPHHATVDVLLRLCREADTQRCYREAAQTHHVVIIDHGVYAKLAYCLTVLTEQHPNTDPQALLNQLRGCIGLWWLHPDLAIYLDTPWPLARERAIARGRGGGNPAAIERLLFLPRLDDSYRIVLAEHPSRVRRIRVGLRPPHDVADEAAAHLRNLLHLPADQEGRDAA